MSFGDHLIHMMRTLYTQAESAEMIEGKTTRYFNLARGARQGDLIAPYLFLIAIEPLLRALKANCAGVDTPGGKVVCGTYAGDLFSANKGLPDAKRR